MQPNDPYQQPPETPPYLNQPLPPPPAGVPPAPPPVYRVERPRRRTARPGRRLPPRRLRLPSINCACLLLFLFCGAVVFAVAAFLLFPARTNFMVIGIDYTEPGNAVARSDTIMLVTFNPLKPYIGILSIPRDLWVNIPGVGQNRINTAHFYAESQRAGSGPAALIQTVGVNFGVSMPYYLRVRFEGFRQLVGAMGGVDIVLAKPMAGYVPGKYHLTDRKALEFVRHRSGSDDFFRMENSQFLVKAIFMNLLSPSKWPLLPGVAQAFFKTVDTNIPVWVWPRLAFAFLRLGPNGIDSHIINREMTTNFTTSEGAMVLLPKWDLINPLVKQMFGP